jgi:hypothetical protein
LFTVTVFSGLSVNLSVLATNKYCLNVPGEVVYTVNNGQYGTTLLVKSTENLPILTIVYSKQLTSRTLDDTVNNGQYGTTLLVKSTENLPILTIVYSMCDNKGSIVNELESINDANKLVDVYNKVLTKHGIRHPGLTSPSDHIKWISSQISRWVTDGYKLLGTEEIIKQVNG